MSLALITGGSGHVGANLSRELIDQGYKVRCIDFDNDHRAFEGLGGVRVRVGARVRVMVRVKVRVRVRL